MRICTVSLSVKVKNLNLKIAQDSLRRVLIQQELKDRLPQIFSCVSLLNLTQ